MAVIASNSILVVNDINPSVVLGLFTWSDDPAYTHREIDVECGRWADPSDVNNAQYVVQPWDWPGHLVRYAVPAGLTNSTHLVHLGNQSRQLPGLARQLLAHSRQRPT